jgi:hypothetical protein
MIGYVLILTAHLLPNIAWGFSTGPDFRLPNLRRCSQARILSSVEPSLDDIGKGVPNNNPFSDDTFLTDFFVSECDDLNFPPTLGLILRSLDDLESGSDMRGQFVDHPRLGNPRVVANAIDKSSSNLSALTPFAAHCLGSAFASILKESLPQLPEIGTLILSFELKHTTRLTAPFFAVVCVGRDPRPHGTRLSDAFCRGVEEVHHARVVYTGIATTPSLFAFCR